MAAKGIDIEFAHRVFEQIRGFGEYGFPESHAASFASIAYATAWLKCHYPTAFACGLLNSQPMGFYSPATILEDAKRHGVQLRPIDVCRSDWDCSLEPSSSTSNPWALRMGLRYVKGIREDCALRIVQERRASPFRALAEFLQRCRIDEGSQRKLAQVGALRGLSDDRRQALWTVHAEPVRRDDSLHEMWIGHEDGMPEFPPLSQMETVLWDHEFGQHSTRAHPLEVLRPALDAMGLPDARRVNALANGTRVHYAGMVICRQRPGTASGVTFMTLEDESGFVNLVLWAQVFQDFAVIAKSCQFLGVTGTLQSEDDTVHLIARRLWVPRVEGHRAPPRTSSRDFH